MRAGRWTAVAAAVAAGVGLAGCGSGSSGGAAPVTTTVTVTAGPSTSATTSSAPTTSPAPTPTSVVSNSATSTKDPAKEASIADGRYAAFITKTDAGARSVTVDVVQFLTGDAAVKAAKEDGGESPPPNDYWIRNANPKLRTFAVTTDATITVNTLAADESGSATTDVPKTFAQLAAYGELSNRLFWVTVKGDRVTRIAEQFLP